MPLDRYSMYGYADDIISILREAHKWLQSLINKFGVVALCKHVK